jgi:hypothetical protein
VIGHQPEPLMHQVPAGQIRATGFVTLESYRRALAAVDIGCCPLSDDVFNRCKSPQKAWEFALSGAAVVCSPTVYGDDPRLAECGGLLAQGAAEWEAHLSRLINNEQERRGRVASLQRFVLEERSLEANLWRWPDAWRQIVSHARCGASNGHADRARSKQKRKKAHRR